MVSELKGKLKEVSNKVIGAVKNKQAKFRQKHEHLLDGSI